MPMPEYTGIGITHVCNAYYAYICDSCEPSRIRPRSQYCCTGLCNWFGLKPLKSEVRRYDTMKKTACTRKLTENSGREKLNNYSEKN